MFAEGFILIKKLTFLAVLTLTFSGCATNDVVNAVANSAGSFIQAATLNESDVKKSARLSVAQMDAKAKIAPANNRYARRLGRITQGLQHYEGMRLNYAVYLSKKVNAFATPDGSIRVYSGLMDKMTDKQVLAVIGHEIGHVKHKHSYNQMQKAMVTRGITQAVVSADSSGVAANLGGLGEAVVNAQFSQNDELEADDHAVKFLKQRGENPSAMYEAIQVLQNEGGGAGGFLSSHPSSPERLQNLKNKI